MVEILINSYDDKKFTSVVIDDNECNTSNTNTIPSYVDNNY